jgi:hypothetical protein
LPLQPSLDDVQPEVASEPLEPRDEPWVPASSAREPEIEGVREAVGDSATACPGAGPRRKDGELVLNVDGAEVCIRTGVPKRARQAPPDVLAPLPEPEPMQIETDNPNEAIQ